MLAFFHSARVHVTTFGDLAKAADLSVPLCHVVREDLFARVQAACHVSADVRSAS